MVDRAPLPVGAVDDDLRGGSDRRRPDALSATRAHGSRSDEQLVAAVRSGEAGAFDTLAARYERRLLWVCRQILNSREDAEDALQDVFAAAFDAILADEREIFVRPWLYRIARNRCINQLRRTTAVPVGSLDEHSADNGVTLVEKVLRRENFRDLVGDVRMLPDAQRIALLLREIDGFAYERIARAMGTTVPAVKSLLVRARAGLLNSAGARNGDAATSTVIPRRRRSRTRPSRSRVSPPLTYERARAVAISASGAPGQPESIQ